MVYLIHVYKTHCCILCVSPQLLLMTERYGCNTEAGLKKNFVHTKCVHTWHDYHKASIYTVGEVSWTKVHAFKTDKYIMMQNKWTSRLDFFGDITNFVFNSVAFTLQRISDEPNACVFLIAQKLGVVCCNRYFLFIHYYL